MKHVYIYRERVQRRLRQTHAKGEVDLLKERRLTLYRVCHYEKGYISLFPFGGWNNICECLTAISIPSSLQENCVIRS